MTEIPVKDKIKFAVSLITDFANVRARRFQPHLSSAEIAKS